MDRERRPLGDLDPHGAGGRKLRLRRRNWARIVLLILAIIAVLAGLPTFATGNIVDILIVVVALAAAVLMYLPASSPYFRRRPAAA
ncbi:hypothetical protein [Microbacterium neimengense]